MKFYNSILSLGKANALSIIMGYPLVAAVCVYFSIDSTPISIAYRFSYLFICLILLSFWLINKNIFNSNIALGNYFLILFWVVYIFRIIYDLYYVNCIAQSEPFYYLQYGIGGCFIPILFFSIYGKYFEISSLNRALFILLLLSCLLIILIFLVKTNFSSSLISDRLSLKGKDDSQNTLGPLLISSLGCALSVCTLNSNLKVLKKIGVYLIGFIVTLMGASRFPFAVMMVLTVLTIAFELYRFKLTYKNLAVLFLILIFILLIFIYFLKDADIEEFSMYRRFVSLTEKSYRESRQVSWPYAWSEFKSHFVCGSRFLDPKGTYIHNIVLDVLMSTGLVGGIPFIISIYFLFKKGFAYLNNNDSKFLFFLTLSFLLPAFTSGALYVLVVPWSLLALFLSIKINESTNNSRKNT